MPVTERLGHFLRLSILWTGVYDIKINRFQKKAQLHHGKYPLEGPFFLLINTVVHSEPEQTYNCAFKTIFLQKYWTSFVLGLSESTQHLSRFSGLTAPPKPLCERLFFLLHLNAVVKLFSAPAQILIDQPPSRLYIAWEDDIIWYWYFFLPAVFSAPEEPGV